MISTYLFVHRQAVDLCAPGASFIVSMEKGAVIASGPREAFVGSDFVASAHTIGEIASGDESSNARDPDKKGAMWNKLKLVKDETQSTGTFLLVLGSMPRLKIVFKQVLSPKQFICYICKQWEGVGQRSLLLDFLLLLRWSKLVCLPTETTPGRQTDPKHCLQVFPLPFAT